MKSSAENQSFLDPENIKIFIGVIVLFTISLTLLVFTPNLFNRVDKVIAKVDASPLPAVQDISAPAVAAVEKQPIQAVLTSNAIPPQFSAWATIVMDYDSGQILYQNNIHVRHAPASTTKLMTALVAQDYYKTTDMLTVPNGAMVGGSVMGLSPGERLTYRGLLYGMLLDSGNDAAYSLAEDYPGGISKFIGLMNLKAQNMGLVDTHFVNPAGFDNPNHYSSAYDLAQIAKFAAQDPGISRVVATKDTSVTLWLQAQASAEATPSATLIPETLSLHNLNQLLDEPGVIGMKTGTTEAAGENLVGLVDRDGHKIITVMLGSRNRFAESKLLIDWVYQNYKWQ